MQTDTATASPVPQAPDKHSRLHQQIQNVESVYRSLSELINRIQGPREEKEGGVNALKDREAPTLNEVLSAGPEEIEDKINRIHVQIQDLHGILFG